MIVYALILVLLGLVIARLLLKSRGGSWSGTDSARGKTIIVTGANSGIGRALAGELVRRGADRVIMACRSKERAEKARSEMAKEGIDSSRLVIELVDLMSFRSVLAFVERIKKAYPSIDVLLCNAGVLEAPGQSCDGVERILQANYLGHFLMVEHLKQRVERIVFVSSLAHKFAKIFDLNEYLENSVQKYSRAKLAEVSYAKHLAAEGMLAYSCNPGVVHTNILAGSWLEIFDRYLTPVMNFIMKSPLEGAQTPLMLSLAPTQQLGAGGYYSDCLPDTTHVYLDDATNIEEIHKQTLEITQNYF